jgi:phosphate transport system substrate-binding protein
MNHTLMNHTFKLATIATIALLGLPSCSTPVTPQGSTPQTAESAPQNQPGGTIKIAGSSSAFSLLKTLASDYESNTKNTKIEPLDPGQSESVIAGVQQKLIDVGGIAKTLTPEENDGSLESKEIAHDGLVVATHPSVTGVTNLTTENLKAIYSGSITNWKDLGGPDATIVVLDRPEDESAKKLLRKHYLGNDLQNSPTAVVMRKEGELIQSVKSTPYSIGTFSLAHAVSHHLPVTRLSLNDIEPTTENIKTGKYPMVRSIVLVCHKNPSPATASMMKYVLSAPGKSILEKSGFVPVSPRS